MGDRDNERIMTKVMGELIIGSSLFNISFSCNSLSPAALFLIILSSNNYFSHNSLLSHNSLHRGSPKLIILM